MSRSEWAWLGIVIAVALATRAWGGAASLGIDHFDEGVYALSAHGLTHPEDPHRLWPEQVKFAPPVYYGTTAVVHRSTGLPVDRAAILVSLAAGVLTVLALWWVGRRWFGPATGITAALLLALSEYHITLSRAGLTDATFALLFLLAIVASVEAARRGRIVSVLTAGGLVGLAWNTKYHGWLAAAITGLGMAVALAWEWRRAGQGWKRRFRRFLPWLLVPVVAILVYLPWALFVEAQPGGYRGLAAYQRTLLSPDWASNLARTVGFQQFLEGPLGRASVPISLVVAALLLRRRVEISPALVLGLVGLALLALTIGGWGALAVLSALAIPGLLSRGEGPWLPGIVLAAWLVAWLLLTPLYHPYARLLLPFTVASCLAAAVWLVRYTETLPAGGSPAGIALAGAVGVGALVVGSSLPDPSDPWKPSRSVAGAVQAMRSAIPEGGRVLVLGDPSVAYYLHVAGRPAFESVNGDNLQAALETARAPVHVVFSIYSKRTGAAERNLEALGNRLAFVGRYPLDPKDLRVLDDFRPPRARAFRARPTDEYDLLLYRYVSAPPEADR